MTADPSQYFESLRRLGLLLGARGRDAEAAMTFGKAVRLKPKKSKGSGAIPFGPRLAPQVDSAAALGECGARRA